MIRNREIRTSEAGILSATSDAMNWNNATPECGLITSADSMKGFFSGSRRRDRRFGRDGDL